MTESDPQATGDCYEAAYLFVRRQGEAGRDKYILVHGNVAKLSQLHAVNHAWVEEDDLVHEVSKGRQLLFSKVEYYELHCVKNVRRYSYTDAVISATKTGHYGPWDEFPESGSAP